MTKQSLIVALAIAAVGCSEGPTEPTNSADVSNPLANVTENGVDRMYRVTIYNLTSGQPLTPPLVATHMQALTVFQPGAAASEGVKEVAENGNVPALFGELDGDPNVDQVVVGPGAVLPGASLYFDVGAAEYATRLSWVSMLICTNDGFTGLRSLNLPTEVGQEKMRYVGAYDAGTEINTESFSDIVPPCPDLTGVITEEMGTGTSDPTLAENGKIHHHLGINGVDDLIPGLHGWQGSVAKVVVKRIS